MRIVLTVLLGLMVSSCAHYKPPRTEEKATIYILNTLTTPRADAHEISVNGKVAGRLKSRQFTWFQLLPGTHTFIVSGSRSGGRRLSALELNVLAGETRYLVYDEETRENYLIEYAEQHAKSWLAGARYVSNNTAR